MTGAQTLATRLASKHGPANALRLVRGRLNTLLLAGQVQDKLKFFVLLVYVGELLTKMGGQQWD